MQNKTIKECIVLVTFFFLIIILYNLNIPIPCLFHKVTHLYCPGCGVTRMFDSIIHLDFRMAFSYNAYMFILLILFILYLITNSIYYLVKKKVFKIPNQLCYVLIVGAIVFSIIRNIPLFSYLAP